MFIQGTIFVAIYSGSAVLIIPCGTVIGTKAVKTRSQGPFSIRGTKSFNAYCQDQMQWGKTEYQQIPS